ncbi:DUF1559 family PulG-like putative transporter, partial [Aporhodopirellula aestuarii]
MKKRHAFTLLELMVVIATIAILVALLIPAVQSAREAARRVTCMNNAKQLGLAVNSYHSTYNVFPRGFIRFHKKQISHTWVSRVLGHIDHQAVYEKFDWDVSWNHPRAIAR